MRPSRRRFLKVTSAAVMLPSLAGAARAQSFPDRPIKLVVAETAGNSNDIVTRMLAPSMASYLGKSVIVENRPGGAMLVGTRYVMESRPDGYTILVAGSTPLIIASLLNKNSTFDLTKDVTPVVAVGNTGWVFVVSPSLPVKTVAELVAYAKANPGKLNIGFTQGSGPQLVTESFKLAAGIDIVGVPYQGGSRVVTDILAGNVHLLFAGPATTLPTIESGGLRALAVTGAQRDPLLPNVPTMAEEGFPSLTLTSTVGLLGPPHMSPEIAQKIYQSVVESARSPQVIEGLRRAGYTLTLESPPEFAKLLERYQNTWLPLAHAAGFAIK